MMRKFSVFCLSIFLMSAGVSPAHAGTTVFHWASIGSNGDYVIVGAGDPLANAGSQVTIESKGSTTSKFGGAMAAMDAGKFRTKRLVLSATLIAEGDTQGSAIWLRADGPAGKLAFASSAGSPVFASMGPTSRQIELVVPPEAIRLVFGVFIHGAGKLVAKEINIEEVAANPATDAVAAEKVMAAAIATVKANALYAANVDWPVVEPQLRASASAAPSASSIYPEISRLLTLLGDGHSSFRTPETAREYGQSGSPMSDPAVNVISPGVGYVLMPGFFGENGKDSEAFSEAISSKISALAGDARIGWIVDLRKNAGGNMWPMLAALEPLLGGDNVGGFRNASGETHYWSARKTRSTPSTMALAKLGSAKVAVLLGPRTASSGEAVAVAFHGRPRTRSFGEATAGLSSANKAFPLPDGSQVNLTTSLDVDRNGVEFGGKIAVDETVIAGETSEGDPVLDAAIRWLSNGSL